MNKNTTEFKKLQDKYDYILNAIDVDKKSPNDVAVELDITRARVVELYNRETRRRKYRDRFFDDLFDNEPCILSTLYRNKLDLKTLKLMYDDDHTMQKLKERKCIGDKTVDKIIEVLSGYFGTCHLNIQKTISIDIDILYIDLLFSRATIYAKIGDIKIIMCLEDVSSIDTLLYIRHTDTLKEFNIDDNIELKCLFPTVEDFIKYIHPSIINILEKRATQKLVY